MTPPRKTPLQAINKETLLVKGLNQLSDMHESLSKRVNEFLDGVKSVQEESKRIQSLPKGEKGDRGEPGIPGIGRNGRDGRDGKDGETPSVDKEEIARLAVKLIAKPKDGKDAEAPLIDSIVPAVVDALKKDDTLKIEERISGFRSEIASYRNQLAGKTYGKDTWARGGGDTVAAGTNVTITTNSDGAKVINASGSGGSGVESVTGLDTDNTDPANPIVQISVDGTTIMGEGTSASPLTAVVGGTGTVTSVSVVDANGFNGTVATATTTPAITLSTTVTGLLKGNGTAISAAVADTDYQAPITLTTAGTSGAATFTGDVLNIPQYSGGGGTPGGSNTQLQYNNSGSFGGIAGATTDGTITTFTSGDFKLAGSSSGAVTLNAPATGGGTLTLPAGTSSIPSLAATQEFTGANTFDNLQLPGSGSGFVRFAATSVASGIVTVPNGNDTLVARNTTDTLTNKTLTSPVINTSVSGTAFGTGIPTFLLTPSSANLASAITDETGSGSLVFATSPTLTTASLGSSTATTQTPADNSTKVATTAYVDAAVLGQNFKEAALVATTANLVGTYVSGVFTYTATGTDAIDGVTLALGNRVLVKNQTTTFQNGIYTVTTAGTTGVAGVLTRSSDANTSGQFKTGDSLFVTSGTANSTTTWAYTGIDNPTIGTDAITFAQTAGQGSFTAGNGIAITGNSIAIDTSITVDKTTAQTLTNKTLTSPVLTTPALGTPTALVGTNITGTAASLTAGHVTTNANLTGAVTSSGNATSLGSFSSASLLGALTDETGTGKAVFASKPTFIGTIQTITAIGALALDGSTGNMFTKTIATGSTFTQSNFSVGQNFTVKVTGAFTITWFSGITWIAAGGTAPTQGAITTYGFTCTGTNTFDGYVVGTQ